MDTAKVLKASKKARLVAWDGCHKIYLAMDEIEAGYFRDNFEHIFEGSAAAMCDKVKEWWDASCFLRFVTAVTNNEENPNAGFVSIIKQDF